MVAAVSIACTMAPRNAIRAVLEICPCQASCHAWSMQA
jgi:hypothetical protein